MLPQSHKSVGKGATVGESTNRRPDIQGLRAVAVLMVVAFHSGLPVPGGFVGVDVFFVISGYVITAMLHREWAATGRIQFFTFYVRRFKRLTPALAVVAAVTVLLSYLLLSPFGPQQTAGKTALGAMLLGANIIIARTTGDYFDAPAELNPLLNTWSLSVEEQFYIIFPAVLFIAWGLAKRVAYPKATPFLIVGSIAAVSFGLAVLSSTDYTLPNASWLLGFYSPFTRAWEFAAGALLALAVTRHPLISQNLSVTFGLVGAGMVAASLVLISNATPFPGTWTLLPVTGTLLLLFVGANSSNLVTRMLATPSMVKIGDWSYSIYLWHWPAIVFAGALWPNLPWVQLLAAVLSIGPALASYKWIEQPIREMLITSRHRLTVVVSATVFPVLVLAGTVGAAPRLGVLPTHVQAAFHTVSKRHAPSERGCMTNGPFTHELVTNCGWNLGANGSPIYLVGDSNAWHFAEAAIGAAELLDRPLWILTTTSCPLISNLTINWVGNSEFFPGAVNPNEFDHCDSYVTFTLDWLQQAPPGTVLVAALDQYWWDPSIRVALEGADATTKTVVKALILGKGLATTVRTLRLSGHQVVLVQTVPTYRNPTPIFDPRSCSVVAILNGTCSRDIPTTFIAELQRSSRDVIEEVAQATGSSVLDLRNLFCDAKTCSTDRDGALQYQDATHLTVSASSGLAPQFAEAIKLAQ